MPLNEDILKKLEKCRDDDFEAMQVYADNKEEIDIYFREVALILERIDADFSDNEFIVRRDSVFYKHRPGEYRELFDKNGLADYSAISIILKIKDKLTRVMEEIMKACVDKDSMDMFLVAIKPITIAEKLMDKGGDDSDAEAT